MPKQYEAIRDRLIGQGLSEREAKTRAAKIYNSTHHSEPLRPGHEKVSKPSSSSSKVKR